MNTSTNLRSDDTSPHSMERNKPERELGGDQRALLVVEDNEALRMEIAELFRDDGYQVLEAADGATALDILRRGTPIDIVLLDLWMPTMDGWRFRMEQRRDPALRDVPVVVLTADDSAQAQTIDADAVLPKPFEAQELCDTVRDVLARHDDGPELPAFLRDAMALIAGAVGHEIANPLTVLIHSLEHARRTGRPLGDEPSEPNIPELLEQCWRMVDTIRSLRDLPIPRWSQKREVDLTRAVQTALGATVGGVGGVLLEQGPAHVAADAQVVHYICRALLRNAVEALSGPRLGGTTAAGIEVHVGREGSEVVLDVRDDGPQIPAEDLPRVFSPDYLGRGRGWSAGLRLWFVREAVQSMGGSVQIYNDEISGVHCRVRLPAAA
ncbi:MAG TPA: HAMP domain-containing sensor histidine kinase [Polyangiaceae bacterium]|nr:HAMP domain-containing sensor histidine kinase [Polyangiaceae bacterium]